MRHLHDWRRKRGKQTQIILHLCLKRLGKGLKLFDIQNVGAHRGRTGDYRKSGCENLFPVDLAGEKGEMFNLMTLTQRGGSACASFQGFRN